MTRRRDRWREQVTIAWLSASLMRRKVIPSLTLLLDPPANDAAALAKAGADHAAVMGQLADRLPKLG